MRLIGLTGGIACGKSTVSTWLRAQPGCFVIDGDMLSRELTSSGGPALPLIRKFFGDSYFFSDGSLDRKKLASLIFSDSTARKNLDLMMDPLLHELTARQISQAKESGADLCFLDFPLLFEMGYDRLCDTVWCVYLPENLQLERLRHRDGLTEQEALQRIRSALSSSEKASRSQVIIDNSGDVSYTISLLPSLLQAELQQSGRRRRRTQRYPEEETSDPSLPSGSPPSEPIVLPEENAAPSTMERPQAARKKRKDVRVPWALPSWLICLLLSVFFLALICFTAISVMEAYLTRQAEKHILENQAIHANFPLSYRPIIEEYAAANNLNPAFVSAIIRNESSFQPRAESGVGARGLMQLMPDTAEWIAGKLKISGYSFERMYDPESNIRFGCWYLQYLSGLFRGDPVCVACAYHAGQGQVIAWLSDSRYSSDGSTLDLSKMAEGPTKNYAGRILKAYGIYQELYFTENFPAAAVSVPSSSVSGFSE